MDDALLDVVLGRIDDDHNLSEAATELLLAACQGDDALSEALGGSPRPRPQPRGHTESGPGPVGAFLRSITVEGFRGVGPAATLDLHPGPGLTVVVGRNGSGKSSFAEALEVLLTETTDRFEKQAVFRDGWRNLHRPGPTSVAAELHVAEAAGTTTVQRRWDDGADLRDGTTGVQLPGEKVAGLDRLGWSKDVVDTYRPFLAHSELEAMLGRRPSDLHDRLASILGLDDLTVARDRLARERRALDTLVKAANAERQRLLTALQAVDDERALACAAELSKRAPSLDVVEQVVVGAANAPSGGALERLRQLTVTEAPAPAALVDAADRLREAAGGLEAVAGTEAARARSVADLLRRALDHRAAHPEEGDCPVCGRTGALDVAWAERAGDEMQRLQAESDAADRAHKEARAAVDGAIALVSRVPSAVAEGTDGVDAGALFTAWSAWAAHPDTPPDDPDRLRRLADHVESGQALEPLVAGVRLVAEGELAAREDRWAPLAGQVAAWLVDARAAQGAKPAIADLKAAGTWLNAAYDDIRNERLRPIAEQAQDVWGLLRHESNVSLGVMRLRGNATQRRVELAAQVDGSEGSALGVMSQGEVNALALSIFLPRATLAGSPFGFVVIDDPVQAMDPAKVDGLARVLDKAAASRQVVVFTHDDRLPAAIRRLGLPARIVQVQRRYDSVIELHPAADPAGQALRDARAVAKSGKTPEPVRRRVVPGLCRLALEATLTARAQRRLLEAGRPHQEVEGTLAGAHRVTQKAALALFGDADAGEKVLPTLNRRFGTKAGTTFKQLQQGAHGMCTDDPLAMVNDTRELVEALADDR